MENNKKTNKKITFSKLMIIVLAVCIVILLAVNISIYNKDNSKQDKNDNNVIIENTDIKEKIVSTRGYYWQNPSKEFEENILMGMQGSSIYFEEDGTFSVDGGNGNWQSGTYEIDANIIFCSIEKHNSEWHNEEETLENTVEIDFRYTEENNTLEVINISNPTLTVHIINLITGELTEELKEFSLEQFSVGNIYSSENKYVEEI